MDYHTNGGNGMNQEEPNKIEFLENDYAKQHYAQQVKKRREVIYLVS